jgi:TRAP transporter 4TM/12TM fusion protein
MVKIDQIEIADNTRNKELPPYMKFGFFLFTLAGLVLAIIYIFGIVINGVVILNFAYYFLIFACFIPFIFLLMPAHKKTKGIPWYDYGMAALSFGICIYFYANAWEIGVLGWIPAAPFNLVLGVLFILLIMEAGRRVGGAFYVIFSFLMGLYPLIAEHMPGVLWGKSFSLHDTLSYLAFGGTSLLGIPASALGELLIGFLLFAGVLIATGAGKFFLNLALALAGGFRGGPAKVAVLSSAFFGSLSGNVFANIVATGSITIPTMKRLGYPPHYAGAIEACASGGGAIMPPVMGLLAFVMCSFLGVEYVVVMVAAIIPSLLYFWGLLIQVDAYAAKTGLEGLPKKELPSFRATLKEGWPYLSVLAFLTWGLVYMNWSTKAPFYASALMLVLTCTRRETWLTPRRFFNTVLSVGSMISQTAGMLLPIGLLTCGLTLTGTTARLTSLLLSIGGENTFLLLLIGAIICYVLGMVGILVPAYIFLAVSLAPAVVQSGGLNMIAVHLFIIYMTTLTGITPPIALGSFLAAGIAKANPMKTALTSARLGIVIYFIPFFFVYNPSLILEGPIVESIYLFALCMLGIVLVAGGLEGYLIKVGNIGWVARPLILLAGLLIAYPEWITTIGGAALAFIVIAIILAKRKGQSPGNGKMPAYAG